MPRSEGSPAVVSGTPSQPGAGRRRWTRRLASVWTACGQLFSGRQGAQGIVGRKPADPDLQREVDERKRAEDLARQRLREIEDLYRNAPVGLCVLDRDLRWVRINDRLAQINGIPAADHIGRTVRELLPALADTLEAEMRRVLETGQPRLDVEVVSETPAYPGVERSWLEQWLPIRDADGRVSGLSIVVVETTEQKQAEAALRASRRAALSLMEEKRMLALFPEQNPNPVLRIASDGAVLYANAASAPLLRIWGTCCGGQVPPAWRERVAATLASGQVEEAEVVCERRVYSCVLAPIGDQGYVNVYARDITLLRESEESLQRLNAELEARVAERTAELRASEDRYRSFVTASTQIIWITDPRGLVVDDLPSWRAFTGQSLEETRGWGWIDAVHPDDRDRIAEAWSQAVATRGIYSVECRVRRHDGQYRWLSVRGVPVLAGGSVCEWVGTCTDVTEQKRAEEEARQTRDEIAHLERVARMGELATSLAHELNQPLAAILSNAQAARRLLAAAPPDLVLFREILDDIIRDDKRAGNVIHRLRLMLQKGRTEPEILDFNSVVREVVQLLHGELVGQNVALRMDLTPELPLVCAGRVEVQQVLVNLLLNGLDAMKCAGPDGRELHVRTRLDGNAVVVTVRDHGCGIQPIDIHRIFEPFYTTKPVGMGMGLALCRRLIEAHGGRIWAANNDDVGASVSFSLPLAAASGDPSHA